MMSRSARSTVRAPKPSSARIDAVATVRGVTPAGKEAMRRVSASTSRGPPSVMGDILPHSAQHPRHAERRPRPKSLPKPRRSPGRRSRRLQASSQSTPSAMNAPTPTMPRTTPTAAAGVVAFWSANAPEDWTAVGVELAGATEAVTDAVGMDGLATTDGVAAAVTDAWKVARAAAKRLSPAYETVTVSFDGCPVAGRPRLAVNAPPASVTPRAEVPPKSQVMSTRAESIGTPEEASVPDSASTEPAATGLGESCAVMTVVGAAVVAGAGGPPAKRCVAEAGRLVLSPPNVAVTPSAPVGTWPRSWVSRVTMMSAPEIG